MRVLRVSVWVVMLMCARKVDINMEVVKEAKSLQSNHYKPSFSLKQGCDIARKRLRGVQLDAKRCRCGAKQAAMRQ